jgi:transcriptional regulator with XRE-family HTH domain
MRILGERIRQRRNALQLTQHELAKRLNTDQKQISKYENGRNEPGSGTLAVLAQQLNTSTDYLLGLTDVPERPIRDDRDLSAAERAVIAAMREGGLEAMIKAYFASDKIPEGDYLRH